MYERVVFKDKLSGQEDAGVSVAGGEAENDTARQRALILSSIPWTAY
jgi:hypothetical protein